MQDTTVNSRDEEDLDIDSLFLPGGILDPDGTTTGVEVDVHPDSDEARDEPRTADLASLYTAASTHTNTHKHHSSPLPVNPWEETPTSSAVSVSSTTNNNATLRIQDLIVPHMLANSSPLLALVDNEEEVDLLNNTLVPQHSAAEAVAAAMLSGNGDDGTISSWLLQRQPPQSGVSSVTELRDVSGHSLSSSTVQSCYLKPSTPVGGGRSLQDPSALLRMQHEQMYQELAQLDKIGHHGAGSSWLASPLPQQQQQQEQEQQHILHEAALVVSSSSSSLNLLLQQQHNPPPPPGFEAGAVVAGDQDSITVETMMSIATINNCNTGVMVTATESRGGACCVVASRNTTSTVEEFKIRDSDHCFSTEYSGSATANVPHTKAFESKPATTTTTTTADVVLVSRRKPNSPAHRATTKKPNIGQSGSPWRSSSKNIPKEYVEAVPAAGSFGDSMGEALETSLAESVAATTTTSSKSSKRKKKNKLSLVLASDIPLDGQQAGADVVAPTVPTERSNVVEEQLPTESSYSIPTHVNGHVLEPPQIAPPAEEAVWQSMAEVWTMFRAYLYPLVRSAVGSAVLVVKFVVIFFLALGNIGEYALEEGALGMTRLWHEVLSSWRHHPYHYYEPRQTSEYILCYVVLYLFPFLCDLLMSHTDCPHYTPHILSNVALYVLSLRLSRLSQIDYTSSVPVKRGKPSPTATYILESDHRQLEYECGHRILRSLRYAIPCNFVLEGFSTANASFAMADPPVRLVLAYLLSLVQHGMLLSPVTWIGWSAQVLLATYLPTGGVKLDFILAVVGLAFVRLVGTLHYDRAKM